MTSSIHPYIPFDQPVRAPIVGTSGLFCWQFDRKWIPYLLAAMKPLLIKRTWENDEERATKEAFTLWATLMQGGECFPSEGEDCRDFFPPSPIFSFLPTNPITHPDTVPDGYLFPPFHAVAADDTALLLLGLSVGDIVTGIPNVPIVPVYPPADSPTVDILVNGAGTVELHLLQFPTGGAVIIFKDQLVLETTVIELNKDLISLPPETVVEIVHEVTFDTPGAHRVRVGFIGRFNDEFIPVGFGGGIRKVVLCDFGEMGDFVDVRQNEDDKCKLEKSVDGENWSVFADLQKCPPILRRVGNTIQYGIPDNEQITFFTFPEAGEPEFGDSTPLWPPESVPGGESGACLAAENIVAMLQQEIIEWQTTLENGGLALGLTTVIAGALALVIVPPLSIALLGLATVIVGIGATGLSTEFTSTVYDRLKCIIFCAASSDGAFTVAEYGEILAEIQAESGTAWDIIEQWIDFRGAVGLTRLAAAAGILDGDCSGCDCLQFTLTPFAGGIVSETEVTYNQIFTLTLGAEAGPYWNYSGGVQVAPCVKLELVSISNFTPGGNPGDANFSYRDCDNTIHTCHAVDCFPATSTIEVGANSLTQAVLTLKCIP